MGHTRGLASTARTSVSSRSFAHPHTVQSSLYAPTAPSQISSENATKASTCVRSAWMYVILGGCTHTPLSGNVRGAEGYPLCNFQAARSTWSQTL
jgi:hypothetical protein